MYLENISQAAEWKFNLKGTRANDDMPLIRSLQLSKLEADSRKEIDDLNLTINQLYVTDIYIGYTIKQLHNIH